jgi:hypothetical protein
MTVVKPFARGNRQTGKRPAPTVSQRVDLSWPLRSLKALKRLRLVSATQERKKMLAIRLTAFACQQRCGHV